VRQHAPRPQEPSINVRLDEVMTYGWTCYMPAGDYVVGFRWDCEETAQVWNSCAEITVV